MELKEVVTLACAGIGISFGFGKQAANLAATKKDVDHIGFSHRQVIECLGDIKDRLARMENDISYLKK